MVLGLKAIFTILFLPVDFNNVLCSSELFTFSDRCFKKPFSIPNIYLHILPIVKKSSQHYHNFE